MSYDMNRFPSKLTKPSTQDRRSPGNEVRGTRARAASDRFGLPLNPNDVKATSTGDFGESSNMRSLAFAPAPPSFGHSSSLMSPNFATPCFGPPSIAPPSLKTCISPPSSFAKTRDVGFSSPKNITLRGGRLEVWKIPEDSIKPVPPFYPLEQTATYVSDITGSEVARRVSDCIRRRSIAASYGDFKAKAKCNTTDGVEFRIRLYAGKGDYKNGIIVEVQRRDGWTPTFQQDCKAILECAEGKTPEVVKSNIAAPVSRQARQISEQVSTEIGGLCAVSKTLLLGSKLDGKVNGMKMLSMLTDGSKVGTNAALNNALKVIAYDNKVLEVLLNHLRRNVSATSKGLADTLRLLSLRIISNCLAIMSREEVLRDALCKSLGFVETLMFCLIHELKTADVNLNEAALAAECLGKLIASSHEATLMALEVGTRDIVNHAKKVGEERHLGLETESSRVASQMECF